MSFICPTLVLKAPHWRVLRLDLALFFLFWELTSSPSFPSKPLGIGPQRRYAASKYTLFMLAGGVPLLFAIILLAQTTEQTALPRGLSFDYLTLLHVPFPKTYGQLYFCSFFSGSRSRYHFSRFTPGCRRSRWKGRRESPL